mmetsp:Transcript_7983/g.19169  ORF Transcript_7983/g.19169 Transcript_7983/m.19169 type:complete len:385 (-) Transcript_7983:531-1685(-)|eukprot:CAMPEP_0178993840 /NCGR_PEP_ID=MMETSP0795-20121207/6935_1 /TAXON_ID=88552 /ORGANISM="Amoebophrya sp., Strain Ameob2" /LENGTH=384 /DNA_ID=CAMNT_0020685961 /DNA_START=96 /DNA_END=1250 /DNA_ORIENTATION=+
MPSVRKKQASASKKKATPSAVKKDEQPAGKPAPSAASTSKKQAAAVASTAAAASSSSSSLSKNTEAKSSKSKSADEEKAAPGFVLVALPRAGLVDDEEGSEDENKAPAPPREKKYVQLPIKVVEKAHNEVCQKMLNTAYNWNGGGTSLGNALFERHLFPYIDKVAEKMREAILSALAIPSTNDDSKTAKQKAQAALTKKKVLEKADNLYLEQFEYLLGMALFFVNDGISLIEDNEIYEEEEFARFFSGFKQYWWQLLVIADLPQAEVDVAADNSKDGERNAVEAKEKEPSTFRNKLGLRNKEDDQAVMEFLYDLQTEMNRALQEFSEFHEKEIKVEIVQKKADGGFELVAEEEEDEDEEDIFPFEDAENVLEFLMAAAGVAQMK